MTEEEWLAGTDPMPMLEYFRFRGRDRQERLLGCAACRKVWNLITDIRCRRAVESSERYADGDISYSDLDKCSGKAQEAFEEASWGDSEMNGVVAYAMSCASSPDLSIDLLSDILQEVATVSVIGSAAERQAQSSLIRDIFPFRPITLSPSYLTPTVLSLAKGIYEDRAFDRMPILADALQDSGCDSEDILNHCRGTGPHVRGCFVVDLILGKE
ncbi:hypothetical protein [Fimbriiglobus ruber]|uniref:hypothetical protein n=1 Tax=Fimbriiglobus ruber TaxID=1908690 RepID=UPI001EE712A9|nr:hypothetical protein [Fimbriiglobus ruber]